MGSRRYGPGDRPRGIAARLRALVAIGVVGFCASLIGLCGYLPVAVATGRLGPLGSGPAPRGVVPAYGLVCVAGLSLCLLNGALVLRELALGVEDARSGAVVAFGCTGLGCGAGLVKLTWPVVAGPLPV
ncbi:MAG: hypothetical protein ABEJ31_14340 [Haloarculaceae archaeon]